MHRTKFAAWQGNVEKLKARLQALIEAWVVEGRQWQGTYVVMLHCNSCILWRISKFSICNIQTIQFCDAHRLPSMWFANWRESPHPMMEPTHGSCVRESNCIEIAQTLRVYIEIAQTLRVYHCGRSHSFSAQFWQALLGRDRKHSPTQALSAVNPRQLGHVAADDNWLLSDLSVGPHQSAIMQ